MYVQIENAENIESPERNDGNVDAMTENNCANCKRTFKTCKGLLIHLHMCNKKAQLLQNNESYITSSTETENNLDDETRKLNFKWNQVEGEKCFNDLNTVYDRIVYWKKNLFLLPSGHGRKQYVKELTQIINSWTNNSPLRTIVMKAIHVMLALLLQKPSKKSKSKDHILDD